MVEIRSKHCDRKLQNYTEPVLKYLSHVSRKYLLLILPEVRNKYSSSFLASAFSIPTSFICFDGHNSSIIEGHRTLHCHIRTHDNLIILIIIIMSLYSQFPDNQPWPLCSTTWAHFYCANSQISVSNWSFVFLDIYSRLFCLTLAAWETRLIPLGNFTVAPSHGCMLLWEWSHDIMNIWMTMSHSLAAVCLFD